MNFRTLISFRPFQVFFFFFFAPVVSTLTLQETLLLLSRTYWLAAIPILNSRAKNDAKRSARDLARNTREKSLGPRRIEESGSWNQPHGNNYI